MTVEPLLVWIAYFFVIFPIDPPCILYDTDSFQAAVEWVAEWEDLWRPGESFAAEQTSEGELPTLTVVRLDFLHYVQRCRLYSLDLPHSYYRMGFPDRASLTCMIQAARECKEYCDVQSELYDSQPLVAQYWNDMESYEDWVLHVYNTADSAQIDWMPVHLRRSYLQDLKGAIGDEAFYSGQLPCPIPWNVMPHHE